MKSTQAASISGVLFLLAGCGTGVDAPAPTFATSKAPLANPNGIAFNGIAFNGIAFNGRAFNGIAFNGRAFNGTGYDGAGFDGLGANGISFAGYTLIARQSELTLINPNIHPRRYTFSALGGSVVLSARSALDPTTDLRVRIEGPLVVQSVGLRKPVLAYLIHAWDARSSTWLPAYTDASGAALWTIPLNGLWNIAPEDIGMPWGGAFVDQPEAITFAGRGYTLAKCIELGYRSWETPELHQSCVRALRADYCGDGRTFTRDGTAIDIYDYSSILQPESEPPAPGQSWLHEASWTVDGATCLSAERIQDWAPAESPDPSCFGVPLSAKYSADCGALTRRGLALWSDEMIRTRYAGW